MSQVESGNYNQPYFHYYVLYTTREISTAGFLG
jgi:hypothetical protein